MAVVTICSDFGDPASKKKLMSSTNDLGLIWVLSVCSTNLALEHQGQMCFGKRQDKLTSQACALRLHALSGVLHNQYGELPGLPSVPFPASVTNLICSFESICSLAWYMQQLASGTRSF